MVLFYTKWGRKRKGTIKDNQNQYLGKIPLWRIIENKAKKKKKGHLSVIGPLPNEALKISAVSTRNWEGSKIWDKTFQMVYKKHQGASVQNYCSETASLYLCIFLLHSHNTKTLTIMKG